MKQHRLFLHTVGLLLLLGWCAPGWAFHTWKRAQLPNGLTLLVVEKHEAPAVAVTLLVKHGASSDPPDRRGVAFLTGRLLTEGTRQRSGDQLAEHIAALGGEFVADVGFDFTTLDWAVLKEDLTPALELLADIVQHPVFPAKEVERERKATLADLQAKTAATPQTLLLRHFFGTGPYGLPVSGDAASLGRIGQPDVVQFHRQAYRPAATILAAAGNVTLEELETLAKKPFGNWSATEKAEEALPSLSVRKDPAALVINRPLVQASVRLALVGAPAASPDAPALLLLSHLLGGSVESRLGQNLREQKTWVYNVRSVVATFRQTGLFSIDMSVPYAVLLPALQETVHEIARLQTEPVSAAELERAKQEVATHFYFDTESVRDIARFLAEHEAYTQGREPPDHVLDALRSVTADEIQRVARTYLDPQGAVAIVEGDPQALRKYAPVLVQGKLPQWDLAPSGKSDGERRESTSSTDQTGR